jgi:hypothetical protein
MTNTKQPQRAYAVIRLDLFQPSVEDAATVKAVYASMKEAQDEAARLNASERQDDVRYICQPTHYFARGRSGISEHPERGLSTLLKSTDSHVYRETVLSEIFRAELMQGAWLVGLPPIQIHDAHPGAPYDVEVSSNTVARQIELKIARGPVVVSSKLALEPSGCVINLEPNVGGSPSRIRLGYRLLANPPGVSLDFSKWPTLGRASTATDTRAVSARVGWARVPMSAFLPAMSITDLVQRLFISEAWETSAEGHRQLQ